MAGSLAQARDLIRTTAPDVLLLDHRLPDGDGVGAIGELRALRPSMRVVVLTASAADHVLITAIEAGAVGLRVQDARDRGGDRGRAARRAPVRR